MNEVLSDFSTIGLGIGFIFAFFAFKNWDGRRIVRKVVFVSMFFFSAMEIWTITDALYNVEEFDLTTVVMPVLVRFMMIGLILFIMIMEIKRPDWLDAPEKKEITK